MTFGPERTAQRKPSTVDTSIACGGAGNFGGIDGRDHIHGTVEVCLRDARLPCVRKASFDSWLAVTHEGDCQPHEDLFTLAQVGHGMCITIKLPKIRALTHRFLHDSRFSHSLPLSGSVPVLASLLRYTRASHSSQG